MRCATRVFWWDIDLSAQCRRSVHQDGQHTDGLRWFDDHGIQIDGTRHQFRAGARHRSLTDEQVRWIRERFAAGASPGRLARTLHAEYHVVYACAKGQTYRSVA